MRCPNCSHRFDPERREKHTCPACGFPYAWPREGFAGEGTVMQGMREKFAQILLIIGLGVFFLTAGGSALLMTLQSNYFGSSSQLGSLRPIAEAQLEDLEVNGPAEFREVTRKTFSLIQLVDPELFDSIRSDLTSINHLAAEGAIGDTGDYRVLVRDVNAFIESDKGKVYILPAAYGGALSTTATDYQLFHYASVLVHEWKHRRNFLDGSDLSPQQEEVSCERAALEFLRAGNAPDILIDRKEIYLQDPGAPQYRRWYEFGRRILTGDD